MFRKINLTLACGIGLVMVYCSLLGFLYGWSMDLVAGGLLFGLNIAWPTATRLVTAKPLNVRLGIVYAAGNWVVVGSVLLLLRALVSGGVGSAQAGILFIATSAIGALILLAGSTVLTLLNFCRPRAAIG